MTTALTSTTSLTLIPLALLSCFAAVLIPDGGTIALYGLCITTLAGILTQFMRAREERDRDERRHRFDKEDREAAAAARATLQRSLEENTTLTRAASSKADLAYETANDVNVKIATIAAAALLQDRATADRNTAAIRQDIADASARLDIDTAPKQ